MRSLLTLCFCAATLAAPAFADKFYVGPEGSDEKMTEGDASYIEGVLLEEKDGRYVIRTEGGVIELPKSQVRKIEKDGLTTAQLEQREGDGVDARREANALRVAILDADREARDEYRAGFAAARARMRDAQIAEATARRIDRGEIVEASSGGPIYDPVLDVAVGSAVDFEVGQIIRSQFGGLIRRSLQPQLRELRRQLRNSIR